MRQLKTTTIGLTCSPSDNMDAEVKIVTEMVISWGGGMGGSTKTVYGDVTDRIEENIIFTDYLGIETTYNMAFVVSICEKQLVTVTNNIFDHLSYGNKDPKCNDAVQTSHYIVDMITKVEFDFSKYIQVTPLSVFTDKS